MDKKKTVFVDAPGIVKGGPNFQKKLRIRCFLIAFVWLLILASPTAAKNTINQSLTLEEGQINIQTHGVGLDCNAKDLTIHITGQVGERNSSEMGELESLRANRYGRLLLATTVVAILITVYFFLSKSVFEKGGDIHE